MEAPNVDLASLSADGGTVVVTIRRRDSAGTGIGLLTVGAEGQVTELIDTDFDEFSPQVSPGGQWIAYTSDESGQFEVYVRPFPNVNDGKWPVSRGGGLSHVWARDGSELFFRSLGSSDMMRVTVDNEPTFDAGAPEMLFAAPYRLGRNSRQWDVAPDGRFLMLKDLSKTESTAHIVVVHNWSQELLEHAPVP